MTRNKFRFLLVSCLLIETVAAKSIIDCRVATEAIAECNPYGSKFLKAKEITPTLNNQKLVRVKNLPRPEEKPTVRVISVEDMIEKYVKIEEPIRFMLKNNTPFAVTVEEEPVSKQEFEEKIEEIQVCKVAARIEREILEQTDVDKPQIVYGKYVVVKGDSLSKLAERFALKTKELAKFNGFKSNAVLCIGQELELPFEQKMVDAFISGKYKIEYGDTFIDIGKKFNIDPKRLAEFNEFKSNADIHVGKIIKLPLPYILAKQKKDEERKSRLESQKKTGRLDMVHGFGKNKLRVTATAYTSHANQTNSNPFVAAWNNRLRPGMKIIAVSRDLLKQYGMKNGTKVRISGLPGYYSVRDKMNKRYRKRIDIYMGMDRRRALRWGRRSVVIFW